MNFGAGEVFFVAQGVILQLSSVVTEAVRVTLVQILLQRRGITLNPLSTVYHIAPVCFACLVIPFVLLELPRIRSTTNFMVNVPLLFGSSVSAFALNIVYFLLVGASSALSTSIAGEVKNWLLIALSVILYGSQVTLTQVSSYLKGINVRTFIEDLACVQQHVLQCNRIQACLIDDGEV